MLGRDLDPRPSLIERRGKPRSRNLSSSPCHDSQAELGGGRPRFFVPLPCASAAGYADFATQIAGKNLTFGCVKLRRSLFQKTVTHWMVGAFLSLGRELAIDDAVFWSPGKHTPGRRVRPGVPIALAGPFPGS